jgi:hypothetical protein
MQLQEGLNQILVVDATTTYDEYDFNWKCRWKVDNVIQFWLDSLMDDNVVFATTNERFFKCNSIFYHMNKET